MPELNRKYAQKAKIESMIKDLSSILFEIEDEIRAIEEKRNPKNSIWKGFRAWIGKKLIMIKSWR